MKKVSILFIALATLTTVLVVLNHETDENIIELGLIASNQNQQIIVWVNNEPVKVIEANNSATVPLRLVFKKGLNNVWLTTKNVGDINGASEVKILEGSWMKPDSVQTHFTWESNKNEDRSPVFQYEEKIGFMEDLSEYEFIKVDIHDAPRIVAKLHKEFHIALKNKSLLDVDTKKASSTFAVKAL